MKKVAFITGIYAFIVMGWLLSSCENESQKEEYAEEQAEAMEKADDAYTTLETSNGLTDLTEVRAELEEAAKELAEEKKEYVRTLQDRQKKLNDRISELDKKLTDPMKANQPEWVDKKRKLTRERDQVKAMILDLQNPMTKERWVTAEEEIKTLITTIDEELKQ